MATNVFLSLCLVLGYLCYLCGIRALWQNTNLTYLDAGLFFVLGTLTTIFGLVAGWS